MTNDYLEDKVITHMDLFIQWAEMNHGDHENCPVAEELKLYEDGIATGIEVMDAVIATEGDDWRESWHQFLIDKSIL